MSDNRLSNWLRTHRAAIAGCALLFALSALYLLFGRNNKVNYYFLKDTPLITVTDSSKSQVLLSEKDMGIPLMPSARVVSGSVKKAGDKVMFSVTVPLPLYTVVDFYEKRLQCRAAKGKGPYGEQYTLSYTKGCYFTDGKFTYPVKNPKPGSRKRTNMVFFNGKYAGSTIIDVVYIRF